MEVVERGNWRDVHGCTEIDAEQGLAQGRIAANVREHESKMGSEFVSILRGSGESFIVAC